MADEFFDRHLGRSYPLPCTDDGAAYPPGTGPGVDYDKIKAAAINALYRRSLIPEPEPQTSIDAQKAQAELDARPDLTKDWNEREEALSAEIDRLRNWMAFFMRHASDPLLRELAKKAYFGAKVP